MCYSGGKDSDVIRILAQLAGVNHEIHHNLTTVDAPETVQYVKSIPGVIIDRPQMTMWELIAAKRMPPTRIVRYCCKYLKETGGKGRVKITGVRWAESLKRKQTAGLIKIIGKPKTVQKVADGIGVDYLKPRSNGLILNDDNDESRRVVEQCYRTTSTMVNPIVDWDDNEVWEFLHHYGCKSNPLYQCGKKRIGCIGCPLAGRNNRLKDFEEYQTYYRAYVRAFDKMVSKRIERGKNIKMTRSTWTDGESVMRWWLGESDDTQITFDDLEV